MKRRLLSLALCLCLLVSQLAVFSVSAETVTGTVHSINEGNKLYVRKSASKSAEVLDKLFNGDVVTILDTVESDGITWYKITTHNNITGYSSADYIKINVTYQTDEEFEAYLTAQKFPESYKVKLRQVWAEHPSWEFKAQHLSMTWAEAISADGENKALKNAVTEPESWKSMEYGAYNWTTGKYVSVDSGGWVTAAPAVVAYYMDPRNFLDDTYIFQFEDLQYSDSHTLEGVKAILPAKQEKHAEDLLKAAKAAKVSAYFLATRMAQEGSKIDGTWPGYEGYYNFFNYGAYADNGVGAVTNGAIYAKNQGWNTAYKCLYDSAVKIGNSYINKGQNTLYYQKFNVAGDNLYNHQYMSNVQAPYSEAKIRANSATAAEKAGALTFIIPVYKEMPNAVTVLPPKNNNSNNNFLNGITVSGCDISPTFNRYTLSYSGMVDETVTSIKISATKNASGATVTGTGTKTIKPGENIFPITVTAPSGQTRVYTVTIIAPGEPDTPVDPDTPTPPDTPVTPPPTLTGTTYKVGETVTGVKPQTAVSTFLKNVGVKDGTVALCDTNGKDKTTGSVATGDILRVYNNDKVLQTSYPVVIFGDVNGDGKINSQDLRQAQRHILGVTALQSYYLTAADTNKDGKLNSQDLRRTQRHILGLIDTLQA